MASPLPPASLSPRPDSVRVGGRNVSTELLDTLRQTSQKTGVNFAYLVSQAAQESGFKVDAQAKTSSARGLFQFIESTWLELVRDHGAKHGLAEEAGQIGRGPDGRPRVSDPDTRQRILSLRDDPRAASAMAAEYARSNQTILSREFNADVKKVDLYLGHFLGPAGASKFLSALKGDPSQPAASLLPEAAAANRGVFYDQDGRSRSVGDIHAMFARKLDAHAEGLDEAASAAQPIGPHRPVRDVLAEERRVIDTAAKLMAFETLRNFMMRASRFGRPERNDSSDWG